MGKVSIDVAMTLVDGYQNHQLAGAQVVLQVPEVASGQISQLAEREIEAMRVAVDDRLRVVQRDLHDQLDERVRQARRRAADEPVAADSGPGF